MDTDELSLHEWTEAVLVTSGGKCANCGSDHKVSPRLIVPEDVGGRRTLSNSVVLCRACELASGALPKRVGSGENRLVTVWVSSALYEGLHRRVQAGHAKSIGALVRYLMQKYTEAHDRFDDLPMQEAVGSVRLNIWVDSEEYRVFKAKVNEYGLSVTDAIKAMCRLYDAEAVPLIEAARR